MGDMWAEQYSHNPFNHMIMVVTMLSQHKTDAVLDTLPFGPYERSNGIKKCMGFGAPAQHFHSVLLDKSRYFISK